MNKMTANEQLLTELTPEEGSVIEGGAKLYLYKATALQAGADWGINNGDDVYARINGSKTGTYNDVDTGETAAFKRWKTFSGTANIQLFDDDPWPLADANLGGFTVSSRPTNGYKTRIVSGSGSKYAVTYKVV